MVIKRKWDCLFIFIVFLRDTLLNKNTSKGKTLMLIELINRNKKRNRLFQKNLCLKTRVETWRQRDGFQVANMREFWVDESWVMKIAVLLKDFVISTQWKMVLPFENRFLERCTQVLLFYAATFNLLQDCFLRIIILINTFAKQKCCMLNLILIHPTL